MRLVVCPSCDTQYDVTGVAGDSIPCRCGAAVKNEALPGVDARILRCGACGAAVGDGARECAYCGAGVVREGAKSLICPKCYARNDEATRFCTACGLEFRPEPVAASVDLVACVHGCGTMAASAVAGVPIHECTTCRSVWVPGRRLEELVARSTGAPPPPPGAGRERPDDAESDGVVAIVYRKCPVCSALMARRNFKRISGVVVDQCPGHGAWLDADELEQLAAFARSGGLARSAVVEEEENLRLAKSAAFRARGERSSGHAARANVKKEFTVAAANPLIEMLRRFLK